MSKENQLQEKLAKIKRKLTVVSIISVLVAVAVAKGLLGVYAFKRIVETPKKVKDTIEQVDRIQAEKNWADDPEASELEKESAQIAAEIQSLIEESKDLSEETDRALRTIRLSLAVDEALNEAMFAMADEDYKKAETFLRRAEQNWRILTQECGSTKETQNLLNQIINLKQELKNLQVTAPLIKEVDRITMDAMPIFEAAKNDISAASQTNQMPRNIPVHIAKIEVIQEDLQAIRKTILKQRKEDQDKELLKEVNEFLVVCAQMLETLRQLS
ncbi:hypothetical protein KY338_04080 [Candidatus Woesearchaeota archaeon]|nr:hypothetical protein [Candidatus Woesearchaeota archaeon]MBW3005492.1 hypothetical protein [Candidatus Woesearchaeota archaeon]